MAGEKARQQLFSSPSGKAGDGSGQLPVTAISSAVAPPALRAPQQPEAADLRSSSLGGGASISSSMHNTMDIVQLSKLPASPIRPVLSGSPVRPRAVAAKAERVTWKSQAAVGPPPDLIWSSTVERLIMNSTKQIEAIEQVAQQAVTVVLRNMAPLRKLARGAACNQINRNAYGLSVRLAMRRSATAELIDASASLLADLAHLFSLIAGQQSAAGQRGRTSGRHIATLMKDLEGGREQFAAICKELKLAGRFMLMRDPGAGNNPDLEERIVEEGQKDTRQLESVLRGVTHGRNKMHAIWSTLSALQAAGITAEDPSWPLLRGLDINTASDVLTTLQLNAKPNALSEEAAAARAETDADVNLSPQASPALGRGWWRSPSKGPRKSLQKSNTSQLKSPSKALWPTDEASAPESAAEDSDVNDLANGLAHTSLEDSALENGALHTPQKTSADSTPGSRPAIQIRNLKHGDVYRGGIVKGAKVGLGQFEYGNGDMYDGQFEADSMHGYGVYTFVSGGLYQGQWDAGRYSGLGVETFPSGGTYHGEYADGCRSGWGACSFANGDYFEGQWAAGSRHGRGMQQCPDHSSFVGSYREGKRHGHGCYTFGNGDRYMGEYENDVPHGHGVYLFASGQAYEGQWHNGSKHGWCVYSLANGQQWAGRWTNGRPDWMQHMAAAKKEAAGSGEKGAAVEQAMAAAAAARKAGNEGAAHFKDHWQPEGQLQASVRRAVQLAVMAAETAAGVQEAVQAAVREAVAAAEAAAAKRKGR